MAHLEDRWHKTARARPDELRCTEHDKAPTARHGTGLRWRVRWEDGTLERNASFAKRVDAEWHMSHLAGIWCLVPKCKASAVTEPPVLLCADHRDLLMQQAGRKKPNVHETVVYFIRNGGRVKIGWTTNLRSRLASLSLPASAVALLVPGGPAEETMLHGRFAAARVGRTEWFEAADAIEDYIAGHQPEPGTVAARLLVQVCGRGDLAA
jgi:hypothetical protein